MGQSERLMTAPTVPAAATPLRRSDEARPPPAPRAPVRAGFFAAAGTVEDQLSRLEIRLLAEAGGDPAAEQDVRRRLGVARARFAGATVRRFLPILIERDVRRQLDGRWAGRTGISCPRARPDRGRRRSGLAVP